MRRQLMVALFCLVWCASCDRQKKSLSSPTTFTADCETTSTFSIDGQYQGKNLYMQNPQINCSDSTTKFCAISVTINDTINIPPDSIASSAFEIPLSSYNFKSGDAIHIVVLHYAGGKPRLLNPEVH